MTEAASLNSNIDENITAASVTDRPKKIARSLATISLEDSQISAASDDKNKSRLFKNLLRLWLSMEALHADNITMNNDLEKIHSLNPINKNYINFPYLRI